MSNMDALLDLGNCLARIETLRTNPSTVHDLMTPVQLVGIIHLCQSLFGEIITGIDNPSAQHA